MTILNASPGQSPHWWWQAIASDWAAFLQPQDLIRELYSALLAALEELSTRGPRSTLAEVGERLRAVGYHDPLTDAELVTC
ncbi:hypothetical protein ACWED2_12630 [Amycolatopsis sp. NPDC005003]